MRSSGRGLPDGRCLGSCGWWRSTYHCCKTRSRKMKIKVIVHEAEEGGFWSDVPAIPGCASQGETIEELIANLHEAIEGCLAVDVAVPRPGGTARILEIAL